MVGQFAQELLSTFGTVIGEVALVPTTGGVFEVRLVYIPDWVAGGEEGGGESKDVLIWDRKQEGGFPEAKQLKQLIRDHIQPGRDLGHSEKGGKKGRIPKMEDAASSGKNPVRKARETKTTGLGQNEDTQGPVCEDCM